MSFEDVIVLASKYTVARMLERDDFESRYKKGEAISVHEFLYPLAQAMDSVAIKADVELGGTDQKFNLLVGRDIQREYGLDPQVILTMPILAGTDGVQKMSKSLDNYIGISEPAENIYGKTLSIHDGLIYEYFELLTDVPAAELRQLKTQVAERPRDLKRRLARELVTMYSSAEAAEQAEQHFDAVFIKKEVPDDIPEFIPASTPCWIVRLLTESGLASSNSDAKRLIRGGGVSIDGERVTNPDLEVALETALVLKVGKRRFMKIIPKQS